MAGEAAQPEAGQAEQQPVQAPTGKPTMAVKVYAPFKIYFEGDAYSVSAVNDVGPFDILPKHHNFLCMLVPCNLTIQTPGDRKVVKISRALMHVKANRVVVFVDV
jgi:F0F1-type ATP synthase epsilon subunit